MDSQQRPRDLSLWLTLQRRSLEPFIDEVFKIVEWAVVVGFFKYLALTHKGTFLILTSEILQMMMAAYVGSRVASVLPLKLAFAPAATKAAHVIRFCTCLIAFLGVGALCIYSMSAVVQEVISSEIGGRGQPQ